jgi:hypothetical protein
MVKAHYDIYLRDHAGKLTGVLYRRAPGDFHEVVKLIVASILDYHEHLPFESMTILAPSGRIVLTREQARKLLD